MNLSTQDADHYFKLMWSLQTYVNVKLEILPDIHTVEAYIKLTRNEKIVVRDALYDNIDLVDMYMKENPQDLSEDELEVVRSWKKFLRGDFVIERLLKKNAVFIRGKEVFGVLGLYDTFEDIMVDLRLPYYAKAVLLPFKGKIIYDGILQGYAISFGSGYKSDLKEAYMAAKQNGRIIESFDQQKQAEITARKKKPMKDWGPPINEISKQVKKLRSSSDAPAIHSPAFSLAKASIEFTKFAVDNPDDIDELWRALKRVTRAITKAETVLYRAEYY